MGRGNAMAEIADEHERTMAFADIALGQLKALRQAATPRNYEIWYTYATGYSPSLNQTINETLARSGTLSDADLEQIYANFISPTRLTDKIDTVGARGERERFAAERDFQTAADFGGQLLNCIAPFDLERREPMRDTLEPRPPE